MKSAQIGAFAGMPRHRRRLPDLTLQNIGLVAWLKGDVGPWLWKPMQRVLPNLAEGKKFADLLLQQGFRDRVLKPLAAPGAFGDMFSYADFSNAPGIADPNFWYDEIHPKESGFAQFAGVLNQQIRDVLPIRKQQAVR